MSVCVCVCVCVCAHAHACAPHVCGVVVVWCGGDGGGGGMYTLYYDHATFSEGDMIGNSVCMSSYFYTEVGDHVLTYSLPLPPPPPFLLPRRPGWLIKISDNTDHSPPFPIGIQITVLSVIVR